jgi:membrane protease YdiL (CAAX protease family)
VFPQTETKTALHTMLWMLCALTLAKSMAQLPYVGTFAVTLVAFMQLYLPLQRIDRTGLKEEALGLHMKAWSQELGVAAVLCLVFFLPYTLAYHFAMTEGHVWLVQHGWGSWAQYVPRCVWAPPSLNSAMAWITALAWLFERMLTHLLGVALPEEVFYRGYLQKVFQQNTPPSVSVLGVLMGRVCLWVSIVFALAHFLGEWNPARLGPFFPSLVFAWQVNRKGSLLGAVVFHAVCNVYGEMLFRCYQSVPI